MKYCPRCGYPLVDKYSLEKYASLTDLLSSFIRLLPRLLLMPPDEPATYYCQNCKKEVLKHFDITGKED